MKYLLTILILISLITFGCLGGSDCEAGKHCEIETKFLIEDKVDFLLNQIDIHLGDSIESGKNYSDFIDIEEKGKKVIFENPKYGDYYGYYNDGYLTKIVIPLHYSEKECDFIKKRTENILKLSANSGWIIDNDRLLKLICLKKSVYYQLISN